MQRTAMRTHLRQKSRHFKNSLQAILSPFNAFHCIRFYFCDVCVRVCFFGLWQLIFFVNGRFLYLYAFSKCDYLILKPTYR